MGHLHVFLSSLLSFPNVLNWMLNSNIFELELHMGAWSWAHVGFLASKDPPQWKGLWVPLWEWLLQGQAVCNNRMCLPRQVCRAPPKASWLSSKAPINTLIHSSVPEHVGPLSLITELFFPFPISFIQWTSQCALKFLDSSGTKRAYS